jgi:CxxC-x17-CxxC domain-containing protein
MKDFKREGKFGKGGFRKPGGSGFGGMKRKSFGSGGFEKKLYQATCDNCGNECQVPFRPSGEKPVYCRDCYRTMEGGEGQDSRRPDRRKFGGARTEVNFDQAGHAGRGGNEPLKKELEQISSKLDRILQILEG